VYSVDFDAGDENNPVEAGDAITSGDKAGWCYTITYDDAATGTITYLLDSGSDQFEDDDTITGGGNTVDVNGTPAEITSTITQDRTTAHPQARHHLEGQSVSIVADGAVGSAQTVSNGSVTLSGSVNHAGLNYTSTLKPSKLDLENMGLIWIKNITKCIASFYNTSEGKVGTDLTGELETVSFDAGLFEGIKEIPVYGGYEREGDIYIIQDQPLPMTARGMIMNLGVHEK